MGHMIPIANQYSRVEGKVSQLSSQKLCVVSIRKNLFPMVSTVTGVHLWRSPQVGSGKTPPLQAAMFSRPPWSNLLSNWSPTGDGAKLTQIR